MGLFKVFVHVSGVDVHMDIHIVGKILVDQFRIRRHGFQGVEYGRQFLVFHLDEVDSPKCGFFINSRHAGHLVPEVTDLFLLDELLIPGVGKNTPFDAFGVFARDNRFNAGERLCF